MNSQVQPLAMLALLISFGSLAVAALSLGWNIYRDLIRKPRLRVSLMNGVITRGEANPPRRVTVSITNFGPSKTKAMGLHLRKTSWWRALIRKREYAFLRHDFEDPMCPKFPCELEVGDCVTLTFRHLPNIFLQDDYNQLGVIDPFGRVHWCGRKNYRDVKQGYAAAKAKGEAGISEGA